tara:strand:+ start:113 stop:814 length:702 start_codon:yes stop_codon:yes gene_type:complete
MGSQLKIKRVWMSRFLIAVVIFFPTCLHLTAAHAQRRAARQWTPLFDGKTLDGWKKTNFGGEGEVQISEGEIQMDFGSSMSGITYTGSLPTIDYEIQLEAQRVDGIDFFCGLTFPVEDSFCSFIVGGWAGSVVGLSSIDGEDASENDTTRYMSFETGRWYQIRIRVTGRRIQAWIDGKRVVDQNIVGRTISTRNEVDLSQPLGISTWETRAALRNIQIRQLRSRSGRETAPGE